MPTPFKEFAVTGIAHAKLVIERMDSGEWEENPKLRSHYVAVIKELERLLSKEGGS